MLALGDWQAGTVAGPHVNPPSDELVASKVLLPADLTCARWEANGQMSQREGEEETRRTGDGVA